MRHSLPILTFFLLTACAGKAAPQPPLTAVVPFTAAPTPQVTETLYAPPPEPLPDFPVIGYLPDYRSLNRAWAAHLTDIIYFSAEPRADGTLDTSRLSEETWQTLAELKQAYGLRVHISFGGWERDGAFAQMSASLQARQVFITHLLEFLQTHDLDGVDFDWEFPKTEAEFNNYISLLTETKAVLTPYGFWVSVALPAESNFPLGEFAVVDRIHLMSYDRGEQHSTYVQAVTDVQAFLEAGIPPEKLILGLPFYGREMSPPYDTFSYAQIVQAYAPAPNVDEAGGIYFNGLNTIRQKVCYGIGERLGGFMVWEIALDTEDASLLNQIYNLAKGKESC